MTAIDTLRGMYVRSPPWVRRALSVPLGTLPVAMRYGSRYFDWRQKIVELRNDREKRVEYVRRERTALVKIAATAPYYRDLFHKLWPQGIPGDRLIDDADWRRIPVLTKPIIRREAERLIVAERGRLSKVSTSGSSGQPLAFFQDQKRSIAEFAYTTDAWSRAGYQPGELRCVFRGTLIHNVAKKFMEFEPALGELRCSPFDLTDGPMNLYLQEIKRLKIKYILGYTSAIAIFASFLVRTGNAPFAEIKGIFPTSERFLPHHRQLFNEVFPAATIVPGYGLSEKVAFATESADRPGDYEFDPTYGFAELLDENGEPIEEVGRRGLIAGTGFITKAMPFVRYDTGDEATLVEAPSPQNGYRLVVSDIASRYQSFLVSRTGALLSAAAITPNSESYRYVSEFQFYQDKPGAVELRMVIAEGAAPEQGEAFANVMRDYLGRNVDLTTRILDRIPTTQRGKRKLIDQRLDRSVAEPA